MTTAAQALEARQTVEEVMRLADAVADAGSQMLPAVEIARRLATLRAALESTAADLEAMRGALIVARDGYTSMRATGLPCLPAYVERAMGLIDAALTQGWK